MLRPVKLGRNTYDASLSYAEFEREYGASIRADFRGREGSGQATEYRYSSIHSHDLLDEHGRIRHYFDNEELVHSPDVSASTSFSFWAWRKVCSWKDKKDATPVKILKSIAASGAFVGIIAVSIPEILIRDVARRILVFTDLDINGAKGVRLSALATLEATTGLVTNCFPQELEERSRVKIAEELGELL